MRAPRFRRSFPILAVLLLVCSVAVQNTQAAERLVVRKLKDLCLNTSLIGNSTPRAVFVVPTDGRYEAAVALVQARLSELSGVTLPVYRDDAVSEELLRKQNVIALGNMANNTFIECLYRRWQVILDTKYPGPGGYVVRTLHNPFGTRHNVIFIGGSDDAGVADAARVFADGLKGSSTALNIGLLMKIRLGERLTPPIIGSYLKKWNVKSWSDSRRMASDGTTTGYKPATYFGWNPISIAGALYYMTGQKEYLQTFKELTMPDPQKIPLANKLVSTACVNNVKR